MNRLIVSACLSAACVLGGCVPIEVEVYNDSPFTIGVTVTERRFLNDDYQHGSATLQPGEAVTLDTFKVEPLNPALIEVRRVPDAFRLGVERRLGPGFNRVFVERGLLQSLDELEVRVEQPRRADSVERLDEAIRPD